VIYGTKFYSRGSQCRQTEVFSNNKRAYGRETYSATASKRTPSWFEQNHYRAWCKFQCSGHPIRYGLLNAFFDVSSIGDRALEGLQLASVTSFIINSDKLKASSVDKIKTEESLDRSISFVALEDIYPTQVGTIPFFTNEVSITIKPINMIRRKKLKHAKSRFESEDVVPSFYIMILLQPERLPLQPAVDERPFTRFRTAPVRSNSFLFKLPCFHKNNRRLPQSIQWKTFNESMRKRYGFKGDLEKFPKIAFTVEDYKDLIAFHFYLKKPCQWMTEKWLNFLEEFAGKHVFGEDENED